MNLIESITRFWRTRDRISRIAAPAEYNSSFDISTNQFQINFFAERALVVLDIIIDQESPLRIESCQVFATNGWSDCEYTVERSIHKGANTTKLFFTKTPSIGRVRVGIDNEDVDFGWRVEVIIEKQQYPDFDLLERGYQYFQSDQWEFSAREFELYHELAPSNPFAMQHHALALANLKRFDDAENLAIMSIDHRDAESGYYIYREIRAKRDPAEIESFRALQKESESWNIKDHHGGVELLHKVTSSYGLDGWFNKKTKRIVEVGRKSASRLLTRLDFSFTSRELLLYTSCRIIKKDSSIVELGFDRFTQSDSMTRNIFLGSLVDLSGSWMLPELKVGDIIDWEYDIAYRELKPVNGKPHLFSFDHVYDTFLPTFKSLLEYDVPVGGYLNFCSVNGAPVVEKVGESNGAARHSYRLSGRNHLPIVGTGFLYEDYMFNPIVCCSAGESGWQDLAKIFVNDHVGNSRSAKPFPESLSNLVDSSNSIRQRLEAVFYWVRDSIKYGSFDANHTDLSSPDRLDSIVEGGVGDCKDKAFVLKQVCQYLGIESYYIIVNMQRGLVVEELPSNQFDHVFLAAECEGELLYLDATNQMNVFGLPSSVCQSLKGLSEKVGRQPIVTLPIDSPEANKVEIVETIQRIEDGRFRGSFKIQAFGRSAREVDESRKKSSLFQGDRVHSMSGPISSYMPGIIVCDEKIISETSNSNCFQAIGEHSRCRLHILGGQLYSTMTWDDPAFLLSHWREIHASRFVGFQRSTILDIKCIIVDDVHERLNEISEPLVFANDICSIQGSIDRKSDSLVYSLRVTIPNIFVSKEKQGQVPEAMESIEKALSVSLSLESG